MINCPFLARPVPTGLTTEAVVFASLFPDINIPLECPACKKIHNGNQAMHGRYLPSNAAKVILTFFGSPQVLSHIRRKLPALARPNSSNRIRTGTSPIGIRRGALAGVQLSQG